MDISFHFFVLFFGGEGLDWQLALAKTVEDFKKVETTLAPSLLVKQPPGIFFSAQTSSRFIVGGCGCVAGDWNLVPGAARLAGVVFANLCRVVFSLFQSHPATTPLLEVFLLILGFQKRSTSSKKHHLHHNFENLFYPCPPVSFKELQTEKPWLHQSPISGIHLAWRLAAGDSPASIRLPTSRQIFNPSTTELSQVRVRKYCWNCWKNCFCHFESFLHCFWAIGEDCVEIYGKLKEIAWTLHFHGAVVKSFHKDMIYGSFTKTSLKARLNLKALRANAWRWTVKRCRFRSPRFLFLRWIDALGFFRSLLRVDSKVKPKQRLILRARWGSLISGAPRKILLDDGIPVLTKKNGVGGWVVRFHPHWNQLQGVFVWSQNFSADRFLWVEISGKNVSKEIPILMISIRFHSQKRNKAMTNRHSTTRRALGDSQGGLGAWVLLLEKNPSSVIPEVA